MSEISLKEETVNTLKKDRLGVIAIAFFVVAAAAPMAAFVGGSPVLFSIVGPATPLLYVIAAALVAIFAVGYLKMSRTVVNAGGFVAFISHGLGNKIAAGAAGIAVFTYLSLQIGLTSQYGIFAQQLLASFTGIDIPPVVWIILTLILITVLTIIGVDTSLRVLGLLIALEIAVVVILLIGYIANEGIGVLSFSSLSFSDLVGPGFGIALLFAFLAFTTFEATVVFAEEAREPQKTVPRAMYLVIIFVAIFYFVATLATQNVVGADEILNVATEDPAGFILALATANVGQWLNLAMQILVVTSFIAMLLGIFNMFARYLFALGRAGVLPKALQRTNKRGAPTTASLVNAIIVGVVLVAFLLSGADPWLVFFWFSALGTAGFITILLLTSVAILVYFARNRSDANIFVTVISPAVSVVAFVYIAYLTWTNFDVLSGGDPTARILVLFMPLLFVIGVIIAVRKKTISFETEKV